jgi:gas vesicle protein
MDGPLQVKGHIMTKRIALIGVSLAMLVTPAMAVATRDEVIAACTSSVASVAATCQTVLQTYITGLKATGGNVDAALGALAYALVTSPNLSPAIKDVVGDAIETIATNISATNSALKTVLSNVASDVKDDGVVAIKPSKEYSPASPSGN